MPEMNKVLLLLSAALACSSAGAAWVEIGANETGTFYVDYPSMQRDGDIVKMWYLVDFRKPQLDSNNMRFLSSKDQSEYDCKQERSRTVYYNNYSDNMGRGRITFTLKDPFQWRPAAPDTIAGALLKIACTKK